ncbi:MAG: hypothetical protein IIZ74_02515 [Erysipelotrichaceae bacterium]|nr:hypothetical protein [Erysipelotrichaceae bacterium]
MQNYKEILNAMQKFANAADAYVTMRHNMLDSIDDALDDEKVNRRKEEVNNRYNELNEYYTANVFRYERDFDAMRNQVLRNSKDSQSYIESSRFEQKGAEAAADIDYDINKTYMNASYAEELNKQAKMLLGNLVGNVTRGRGLFAYLLSNDDRTQDYIKFFRCYKEYKNMVEQLDRKLEEYRSNTISDIYYSATDSSRQIEREFRKSRNDYIQNVVNTLKNNLPDDDAICELYDYIPEKGIQTGKQEDIRFGYLGIHGRNMRYDFKVSKDEEEDLFNMIHDRFPSQGDNMENADVFVFPVYCDASDDRSLVFVGLDNEDASDSLPNSNTVRYMTETVILNEMQAYPVGTYKVSICNASGADLNLQYLSDFIRNYPALFGNRINTTADEISTVLRNAVRSMNEIALRKLKPNETTAEFNRRNPNSTIPYNRIVVTGFPQNFTAPMIDDLTLLLENGNRCGFNVMVFYDESADKYTKSSSMTEMKDKINRIINNEHAYRLLNDWDVCRHIPDYSFFYQPMPIDDNEIIEMKELFGQAYEEMSRKFVTIEDIISKDQLFNGSSTKKLSIPIGINEYGNVAYFEVGNAVSNGTSHYAVVVGPTGSGKSSFLHTLITSAVMTYSPDELQLYLLDFKEGTEFKIYEDYKIPHIKCIALDASQDFGKNILKELHNIMLERLEKFKTAESVVTDIESYRKLGHKMPRILLVADEFQTLFSREFNKAAANEAAIIYGELISKARVVGIHMIFATQTVARLGSEEFTIPKSSFQEMHVRIGLQCQDAEEDRLFGSEKKKEIVARRSSKKGSAIYMENDIVSNPVAVQFAYLPKGIQANLLKRVSEKFADVRTETVVFRGADVPEISAEKIVELSRKDNKLYLGLPLSMDGPIGLNTFGFRKNNIIIMGDDRDMLSRIFVTLLEQYAGNTKCLDKSIYYFNGYGMVETEMILNHLSNTALEKTDNIDSMFGVVAAIRDVYQIFDSRKKNMAARIRKEEDQDKIYLIISGYQFIEPIMRMLENPAADVSDFDVSFAEAAPVSNDPFSAFTSKKTNEVKPGAMLKSLLETGYMCGISVIMSCGDFTSLRKLTGTTISSFNNKVVLKTASEEIYKYIDSNIKVSKISANSVVFVESGKEAVLLKPYRIGDSNAE